MTPPAAGGVNVVGRRSLKRIRELLSIQTSYLPEGSPTRGRVDGEVRSSRLGGGWVFSIQVTILSGNRFARLTVEFALQSVEVRIRCAVLQVARNFGLFGFRTAAPHGSTPSQKSSQYVVRQAYPKVTTNPSSTPQ
ncbi:hypothetical protein AERO9AM_20204 [Aeromicrobium sp. 9AM]|nr:hypothetical protein AERO9AM_20204 [Aeromicrobium sp. 9AM]